MCVWESEYVCQCVRGCGSLNKTKKPTASSCWAESNFYWQGKITQSINEVTGFLELILYQKKLYKKKKTDSLK